MNGTWTVDGIEDGIASLARAGRVVHLPAGVLPPTAREGDVLEIRLEASAAASLLHIEVDAAATARARAEAAALLDLLRERDPRG